jgi:hypothetical protein
MLILHELRHVAQQHSAVKAAEPELDPAGSSHERQARSIFDPNIKPLAVQRVQCSPDDVQFSLGEGVIDKVGRSAFGDTAWPFLKAVFEGFVGGLATDVKSGRAEQAREHLTKLFVPWNALKFQGGYLLGLVVGLVSPITDLVKGIVGAVRLAISALDWMTKWSPLGIATSPERQQKIVQLFVKFADLENEWNKAVEDFKNDPRGTLKKIADFLDNLMVLALGKAREIGAKAAHSIFEFLEKDFFEMGQSIGEVIGALIAQVLLLVFTDAIGNLISKGASVLGKAAEFVAGKAVEVFEWVKGFASEVVSAIRSAVKGALKVFEGLANKAIEAFDALKAVFTEAETLGAGGETLGAGGEEAAAATKTLEATAHPPAGAATAHPAPGVQPTHHPPGGAPPAGTLKGLEPTAFPEKGLPGATGTRHLPREFEMPRHGRSGFPSTSEQIGTAEQRAAGQVRVRGERVGPGEVGTKRTEVPAGRTGARDHWRQHGHEFPEYRSARQYEQGAIDFCRDPATRRFYYRFDGRPTIGYYNASTNTFAATSVDGQTIYTYFRPEDVEEFVRRIRLRGVPKGVSPRHSVPLRRDEE